VESRLPAAAIAGPLLAVRHLVENDAAFAMKQPLLVPTYLVKFPAVAPQKACDDVVARQEGAGDFLDGDPGTSAGLAPANRAHSRRRVFNQKC